ncbi:hypothetical protein ELI_3944 [Eubacterium callanderi]|uniref:Uncharacterized protein n=1 Tax=Eubacterium callanderi TaxID=53442 RepID=E3GGT3_9FIRM|nr:hypothetical protein ELI_3944 [Eubacterium callanderi]
MNIKITYISKHKKQNRMVLLHSAKDSNGRRGCDGPLTW